ncbi:hypothetical protein ELQ88_05575 [Pseudomonas sp. MPC6]|nr:hypothetical protein ELQ88_05575 [Pseudomonas sp. MPC6]
MAGDGKPPVGASSLAMDLRATRLSRMNASSLTSFASKLAPTRVHQQTGNFASYSNDPGIRELATVITGPRLNHFNRTFTTCR